MFTWEESGQLRSMLLVVKWLLIAAVVSVAGWLLTRL